MKLKYRVIKRFRGKYSIEAMCEVFEVSRSGYYAWRKRQERTAKDQWLADLIVECQKKCRQTYWINTSGNDLVRHFMDKADKTTQGEIERLIAGEAIEKAVRLELTYNEIDNSIDNLWSVLFTTGYLTQAGKVERSVYKLMMSSGLTQSVAMSKPRRISSCCVYDS